VRVFANAIPRRATVATQPSLIPVGEASDTVVALISGGQPVVLVRYGRPIVVVLDVDSYVDAEPAVAGEHLTECRWAAVSSAQKRSTS
jgi:hypothetical protein